MACPQEYVSDDVWDAIESADLYQKGLPPIHGGTQDQTRIFREAFEFIQHEQAHWKAGLMKENERG